MKEILSDIKLGAYFFIERKGSMGEIYEKLSAGRQHKIKMVRFPEGEVACEYLEARHPVTKDKYESLSTEEQKRYGLYPEVEYKFSEVEPGILMEQDVAVQMRDGVRIYIDIFRPKTEERIPAILAWSGYGKQPRYEHPDLTTRGVPKEAISKYCKEEGPDPLYWCRNGYAVINVDPRGIGHSEGDFEFFGGQDGRDGYDVVEWLAKQTWCNGKVGMAGNSCLAMMQWRIAAECPPHLACIAPWEGTGDLYRESLFEGGIKADGFPAVTVTKTIGEHYVDDMLSMMEKEPFVTSPYWQDKIPDYSKIRIPTYVTAGWSHLHVFGSILGFRFIQSEYKWLRCHREFEWPDFYSLKNLEELKAFFDRYLKDIYNGWEMTPRVRIEVMDAYAKDAQTNREENNFPLDRTVYQRLYLDAAQGQLKAECPIREVSQSYESLTEESYFTYRFQEETELTGYIKLKLWVAAECADDMDLYINIQKLDRHKKFVPTNVMGCEHPGAWGKLRVSRRKLDKEASEDFRPVLSHVCDEKLVPGEIVPVEIAIAPTSRIWHEGEYLQIQIAGRYIRGKWFEPLTWENVNSGKHYIYTGGRYDSYIQIPVIPKKRGDDLFLYRNVGV